MKTRKMFVVILVAMYLLTMLTGCVNNSFIVYDTGKTNEVVYRDYEKWEEENQIRMLIDIKMSIEESDESSNVSGIGDKKLSKSKERKIQKLQEGIVSFFKERYNIDVSEKIKNQKVAIFSATGMQEGVMGYVDVKHPNILNLNEKVLKEYSELFETTYIHETLHQIGFRSKDVLILEEGITDALTDMICCYIEIDPVLTEYYYEARTLGYQLLVADPEIVSCYLEEEEFDILKRINEKLENVPQVFLKADEGKILENRLSILYALSSGTAFGLSTDPYWLAFEAQEIVKAYCQECEPDESTIDYIRSHYLVIDYEAIAIFEDENGYGYYFE